MIECALDTLLYTLRDAVEKTSDANSVRVDLPGAGDPASPLVLPIATFRDHRQPDMTLLSLEFDCYLRLRRIRGQPLPELILNLGKPRWRWLSRSRPHRMRISYRAVDGWRPRVELDGRPLPLNYHGEE
ncbi:hypothetical protein KR767_09460 [Luteibacter anthropi]|uniref:Uncharacterized protein n=1 Tax=Luteibacter anthropi TaxID=564369 RepID=A0A7X5UCR0_9GAMM|nr:hypothetical protein [Luteibacter anthropi]NII08085.1 hypothetical protein [Luteibacter anthropi]URX64250.1 hypothetical protein KR767_09460 [Luteibacter anthropi]